MTAIPITSEGRASCGSVTQTNSVNTNKARNIGCKGLEGWLTKCRGSETRIGGAGEREKKYPYTKKNPKKKKKKKAERLLLFLLWEQLYRRSSYLSRKCHEKTWMGLAEKLLIVPFVCPLITFFFFFPARPTPAWQECGNITVFTSAAVLRGGGGSGRRLVFESRLKYATADFFFFFWIPKPFPLVHISLCGFTCECIC